MPALIFGDGELSVTAAFFSSQLEAWPFLQFCEMPLGLENIFGLVIKKKKSIFKVCTTRKWYVAFQKRASGPYL